MQRLASLLVLAVAAAWAIGHTRGGPTAWPFSFPAAPQEVRGERPVVESAAPPRTHRRADTGKGTLDWIPFRRMHPVALPPPGAGCDGPWFDDRRRPCATTDPTLSARSTT